MQPKKKPVGVIVLGMFNLVVLGMIQLITFLMPQNWQMIQKMLKESGINVNLSPSLLKTMIVIQSVVSLVFIICGAGLLFKKEWARKFTVYFAFSIAALVLISVLLSPASIRQAVVQIIYPGILIIYFTNRNIEDYFRGK
ncbi:MAG: hypothetical protein PHT53_01130 [Candidatus Omnitrophica bacterium]|nr:hypothetical protein [Candidatus Omnitrophota bacterium]